MSTRRSRVQYDNETQTVRICFQIGESWASELEIDGLSCADAQAIYDFCSRVQTAENIQARRDAIEYMEGMPTMPINRDMADFT